MDGEKQEYSKADLAAILMGISRSTERLALSLAEESKIEKNERRNANMSQSKELSSVVSDIRAAGESIIKSADALEKMFSRSKETSDTV